jgi:ADP-heptose:LPS heptosyltransferase
MHIAVSANIPTVAIVGGTPAFIILPERDNIKVLEDPELKWWVVDAPHAPRVSRLNEIMPEMVLEKINDLG